MIMEILKEHSSIDSVYKLSDHFSSQQTLHSKSWKKQKDFQNWWELSRYVNMILLHQYFQWEWNYLFSMKNY